MYRIVRSSPRTHCFVPIAAGAIAVLFAGPLGAQAAGSTMYGSSTANSGQFLRQMDTDRNGTVSKHEFLQFMGRKFERLDTNRNGKLERSELRSLVGKRWDRIHAHPR
jgi:hypothetical protein